MKKKPNLLFIMTDEQCHDCVGYRNSDVITPNLDAMQKESVDFCNAYTTNPSCIPARAAIFAGRYPTQCGAPGYMTAMNDDETTFMKLLKDGGYHTSVVGKQHFYSYMGDRGYCYEDIVDDHFPPEVITDVIGENYFGLPSNFTYATEVNSYIKMLMEAGFKRGDELFTKINDKGIFKFTADKKYYVDEYIGNRGLEWIDEIKPKQDPWFCTISFPGPHMPFDGIGLEEDALYEGKTFKEPYADLKDIFDKPAQYLDLVKKFGGDIDFANKTTPNGFTKEDIQLMKRAYYANMTLIDNKIGEIVAKLKEIGEYDNTLIIFTSDHGDYMGEYGIATKSQCCAECLQRIPFLMKPPIKDFKGYVEKSFVSSVEIAATFLTAAELEVPKKMQKRSLTQFYDSKVIDRWDSIYMEARDIRAVRDQRYKLSYYRNRPYGELYDLVCDPHEKQNLWDLPEFKEVKARMMCLLMDKLIDLGENMEVVWHPQVPII